MTNGEPRETKRLNALFDTLDEEIINASDEDILAEAERLHGDPNRTAARMRAHFMQNVEEREDLAHAKRSWEAGEKSSEIAPWPKQSS